MQCYDSTWEHGIPRAWYALTANIVIINFLFIHQSYAHKINVNAPWLCLTRQLDVLDTLQLMCAWVSPHKAFAEYITSVWRKYFKDFDILESLHL